MFNLDAFGFRLDDLGLRRKVGYQPCRDHSGFSVACRESRDRVCAEAQQPGQVRLREIESVANGSNLIGREELLLLDEAHACGKRLAPPGAHRARATYPAALLPDPLRFVLFRADSSPEKL